MPRQVLFMQGAGEGAYDADAVLVDSLRYNLGPDYEVRYPYIVNEAEASYEDWRAAIAGELATMQAPVMLAGHSIGGSALLKYLSENTVDQAVAGIFVMATPFWGGDGWRYAGYEALALPNNLSDALPQAAPVYMYHCQDDEVVPYEHLGLFAQLLPQAHIRTIPSGGHQLTNDLLVVAQDIKRLI